MANFYVDDTSGNKLMSELIASGFNPGDSIYISGGSSSDYRTLTIDEDCTIHGLYIGCTSSNNLQTTDYCKVIINDGVSVEINYGIYLSVHSILEGTGTKKVVTENSPGVYPVDDYVYGVEAETAPGSNTFDWFYVLDDYNPETISYSKNTTIPILTDPVIKKNPIGGVVGKDGAGKNIAPYTFDLYTVSMSRTMFGIYVTLYGARTFYSGNTAYMPNVAPDPGCYYMGMKRYRTWNNGISELVTDGDWTIDLDGNVHTFKDFKTFTLAASITDTDTSLTVNEDISALPSEGFVCIDDELIRYTSKDDATKTLSGLVRGEHITDAAAHTAGATVNEGGFVYYFETKNNMCWRSGTVGSYVLNFGQTGPQPGEGGWRYLQAVTTGSKVRYNQTRFIAKSSYTYFYVGGTVNLTNVDFTTTAFNYKWTFALDHRFSGEVCDAPGELNSCYVFGYFSNIGTTASVDFTSLYSTYANEIITFRECFLNLSTSCSAHRPIKLSNTFVCGSSNGPSLGYNTIIENVVFQNSYPSCYLIEILDNSDLFIRAGANVGTTNNCNGAKQGSNSKATVICADFYLSGVLQDNISFDGQTIIYSSGRLAEFTLDTSGAGVFNVGSLWLISSKLKFVIRNDAGIKAANLLNSTKRIYQTNSGNYSAGQMLEINYYSSDIKTFLPYQPNIKADLLAPPYANTGVKVTFSSSGYAYEFLTNSRLYNFNLFDVCIPTANNLLESSGVTLVVNNKTTVQYDAGKINSLIYTNSGRYIVYADEVSAPVSLVFNGLLISGGKVYRYISNTNVYSVVNTSRPAPALDVTDYGMLFLVPVTSAGSITFEFNLLYSQSLDSGDVTYYLNITGPGVDEKESNTIMVPANSVYFIQKTVTVDGPGLVTIELQTDGNSLVEDLKCYGDIIESPTNNVDNIKFSDPFSGGVLLTDSNYVAPNGVGTIVAYGFMW